MNAYLYLFLAYTFIWIGIFGYIWFLDRKTRRLKQEVTLLEERIDSQINRGESQAHV